MFSTFRPNRCGIWLRHIRIGSYCHVHKGFAARLKLFDRPITIVLCGRILRLKSNSLLRTLLRNFELAKLLLFLSTNVFPFLDFWVEGVNSHLRRENKLLQFVTVLTVSLGLSLKLFLIVFRRSDSHGGGPRLLWHRDFRPRSFKA